MLKRKVNSQKNINNLSNKTLDTQHSNKIEEFRNEQEHVTDEMSELENINIKLNEFAKIGKSNLNNEQFDEFIQITDRKKELENQLENSHRKSKEIDYYIDTADIIFQYYDIIEKGDNNESDIQQKIPTDSILKYFTGIPSAVPLTPNNLPTESNTKISDCDRASLLDKYLASIDSNYIKSFPEQDMELCPNCGSHDRIVLINDGFLQCNQCSTIENIIIDHEKPSYKDPPKEISYFAYKREMIDALKSRVPCQSETMTWENTKVLCLMLLSC
jgi:hypothetical protein